MQQTGTNLLKQQRLRKGLTLRQLADQCAAKDVPVDFGQLGKIERGESVPRPALRLVLAELLELDVSQFEKAAG